MAGCALLGGETAELPGFYSPGEYDLAGFSVGVVSRNHVLGPERVRVGDELVAIASSGLHSNGYSLARYVLESKLGLGLEQFVPELGCTLSEELLVPTRIYALAVRALMSRLGPMLHALCHVTGGGVPGNYNPRATDIHMDKIRARIITDTAAFKRQRRAPHDFQVVAREPDVDGLALHVQASFRDTTALVPQTGIGRR